MFQFSIHLTLSLYLVAFVGSASVGKIGASLEQALKSKGQVDILVSMAEGTGPVLAQVTGQRSFVSGGDQATAVYTALSTHAKKSQESVLQFLHFPLLSSSVKNVESFWISNQILIQGADRSLIESLAAMSQVSEILEDGIVRLDEPEIADSEDSSVLAEWGIEKIHAEDAWLIGGNGTGAVIGIIDTGARYTHEAIRDNYRGGTHSWYDPYAKSELPNDRHSHGTHVTGTAAGSFGIGVAPGAKWISCKGIDDNGFATESAFIACGQFMACPTTFNGQNPDCSLAPHVVSNSWRGQPFWAIGWYDAVINAWHAANIIPVFAVGNSGPGCSTITAPGDSEAGVLGIGATTSTDGIVSFSSKGPSPFGTQKPDISAPGNAIRSAGHLSDNGYATMSGTSMATPHVAGLVGLIKSRNPSATFEQIKQLLQNTADRNTVPSGQICSSRPDSEYPNYTFGYGRVNALRVIQALQES